MKPTDPVQDAASPPLSLVFAELALPELALPELALPELALPELALSVEDPEEDALDACETDWPLPAPPLSALPVLPPAHALVLSTAHASAAMAARE